MIRQFGTSADDAIYGIAVDSSNNIIVVGQTLGALPGEFYSGAGDAFVRKYDAAGNILWNRQFGSTAPDAAMDVKVYNSDIYVAGFTVASTGGTGGDSDGFLRKYNAAGGLTWSKQISAFPTTSGGRVKTTANAVAITARGVAVAGRTTGRVGGNNQGSGDGFIVHCWHDGTDIWSAQFGNSDDESVSAAAADSFGVYVVGRANPSFGGGTRSGYVRRFDVNNGSLQWSRFISANEVIASGVAVDSAERVIVVGEFVGMFPGQTLSLTTRPFVQRYDSTGLLLSTEEINVTGSALAVVPDTSGGFFVTGMLTGSFPGQTSAGDTDFFIRQYTASGAVSLTRQFGASGTDVTFAVAVSTSGIPIVGGRTYGANLPGQTSVGVWDAFLWRLFP